MKQSTAITITCMISDYLDKHNVGVPSSYLETIERKLLDGKFVEVFEFFENRLSTAKELTL